MSKTATPTPLVGPDLEEWLIEQIKPELEISVQDNGIGSYEFWGSTGNHSDLGAELETGEAAVDLTGQDYDEIVALLPVTFEAYSRHDDAGNFPCRVTVRDVRLEITGEAKRIGIFTLEQD